MVSNVINQPTSAIAKLSSIIKIQKYRGLYEGHHFILMAMEVHGTLGSDMNHFIRECACLFHDRQSKGHLSLFFCIRFFNQCVNITFQRALASTIKKKITLTGDVFLNLPLLLDLTIGMQVTLEGP